MKKYTLFVMSLFFMKFGQVYANEQTNIEQDQVEISKQVKPLLFGYSSCPYCVKVFLFLQSQGLVDAVTFVDASVSENADRLKMISGKTQVPYLVDSVENVSMPESDDIIAYFMKKYDISYAPVASYAVTMQKQDSQKSYNPKTFIQDVTKYKKPVIILISTTWCPPCQIFKPIFLKVAQQYAKECEFILVDGDANIEIVQQLNIPGYPSVVGFKNGKKMNFEDRNYRSEKGFIDLVKKLIEK